MNDNTRDAVIVACTAAVVIAAVAITGSLGPLWLLILVGFAVFFA